MLPCSPSDSVLMHSLFLSLSLLHQLSRVPVVLRGHPSKVLTWALQQLIAASWCLICRVAKGTMITRISICRRRSFVPPFSETKPEAVCWGLSFYCSLKKDVRSGIWNCTSRRDCTLDRLKESSITQRKSSEIYIWYVYLYSYNDQAWMIICTNLHFLFYRFLMLRHVCAS